MSEKVFSSIFMIGGAILGVFGMPLAWAFSMFGAGVYIATMPEAKPSSDIAIDAGGGALGEGKIYGWQGAYLTAQRGIPIPIVYGTHRVGGNVINLNVQESTVPGEITYGVAYGSIAGTWYNGATTSTPMANIIGTTFTKNMESNAAFTSSRMSKQWFRYAFSDKVDSVTISLKVYGGVCLYAVKLSKGAPPYNSNLTPLQMEAQRVWFDANGIYLGFFQSGKMSDLKTIAISNMDREEWALFIGGNDSAYADFQINITSIEGLRADPIAAPNSYVSYLDLLMAVCEGEIESINDVQIEKQPLSNYSDSVIAVDYRFGLDKQEPIRAFKGSTNTTPLSTTLLQNTPYVHTGVYGNTEEVKVGLYAPQGLYSFIDADNQYKNFDAKLLLEYKVSSATAWNDGGYVHMVGVSPKSFYRWWGRNNLPKNYYDVRITKQSSDPDNVSTFGSVSLVEVDETEYGDKIYPHTALLYMRLKSGEQLSGRLPNITSVVHGSKVSVPALTYGATTAYYNSCYYAPSGVYMAGENPVTWNGATFVKQYSNNPVWCMYDLFKNNRYGLGDIISESILNKDSFYESAKYCDTYVNIYSTAASAQEKQFELDVGIDGRAKAPDLLDQMLKSFRGFMTWTNGEIKLRIDKPEDPVQMFNMSNIVENSFNVAYRDREQRPNSIELQFTNRDLNYEKDTILLEDYDSIMTEGRRELQVPLFGVTRVNQIIRAGRYQINYSKYIKRTIQFEAGLDAVHCEAGDVFVFQHDAPNWNWGGRILSASPTHVYLDQGVTLSAGISYKLMCQLTSDTLETHYISPSLSGSKWDVTVTGAFSSTPPEFGKWMVGKSNVIEREYRALQLVRTERDTMRIMGIEYNENVYTDGADYNSAENVESVDVSIGIPDHVQNLTARVEQDYFSAILLDWNKPDSGSVYKGCDLYAKTNYGVSGESEWQYWKQTDKTNARYSPIVVNQGYAFKAVAFNEQFQHASFLSAPTTSAFVYVTGVETGNVFIVYTPPTITGLTIE